VSLIARHLEATGMPTVCLATAYDIMATCKPPRTVFVDFPLGNTTGRPFAPEEQYAITRAGIEGLLTVNEPGAIRSLDLVWSEDESWKAAAVNPDLGDRRKPRTLEPQYQFEEDRLAAEAAGAASPMGATPTDR
jgi:D-proline reductase (dithiol) PrdB